MKITILTIVLLAICFQHVTADPEVECVVSVDRMRGFTFCNFGSVIATGKDLSKVGAVHSQFQGQLTKNELVSRIAFLGSDFPHIPNAIFTTFGDIIEIKMGVENIMRSIRKEDFVGASELKIFNAPDSSIPSIPEEAFTNAPKLEEVILNNNSITTVAHNAFAGLNNLKSIDLSNNQIKNLDKKFFANLPSSVLVLKLAGNSLDKSTEELYEKFSRTH
ncbi:unnamed protein product [Diamesa hyperborea]